MSTKIGVACFEKFKTHGLPTENIFFLACCIKHPIYKKYIAVYLLFIKYNKGNMCSIRVHKDRDVFPTITATTTNGDDGDEILA